MNGFRAFLNQIAKAPRVAPEPVDRSQYGGIDPTMGFGRLPEAAPLRSRKIPWADIAYTVGAGLNEASGDRGALDRAYKALRERREDAALDEQLRLGRGALDDYLRDVSGAGAPRLKVGSFMPGGAASVGSPPASAPRRGVPVDALARLSLGGFDIRPLASLFKEDDERSTREGYLGTLAEAVRPEAALDPSGYAQWSREQSAPMIVNAGGGTIAAFDRRTGQGSPVFRSAPEGFDWAKDGSLRFTKGGPQDPGYLGSEAEARAAGQRRGAPPVSTLGIVNSTGDVTGPVLAKVSSSGVESLTPQERQVWDYMRLQRTDPLAESLFGAPPASVSATAAPPRIATPRARPPVPKVGAIVEGFRYRGGDPSKPASWERVR